MTVAAIVASASTAVRAQSAPPTPSCTVNPAGQNFSGQNLTNFDFHAVPAGSLKGANFNNANLSGAVFAGQDLTGATFQNANLGPSQKGSASFNQATLTSTCFIDAVMNATDFTFAIFNCTDFTGTSLMQANFGPAQTFTASPLCRTKFNAATIDINAISTTNWGLVDFSYTNFQNVAGFSLAGQDITGAILVGANFQNMDMTGANLTQVDFSYATLTGADMTNTALNGATLIGATVDFATLSCARFYYQKGSSQDLNAQFCVNTPATTTAAASLSANLQSANLTQSIMTYVTLDYALLNNANLSGVDFKAATFRQASLEAVNQLNSATIAGTSFVGAVFDNAQLNSVVFTNSNLTSASFIGATLANTSFAGALMPNANFQNTVLESVNFSNSILQSADFTRATLKTVPQGGGSGVTFSCAQLGGANFTNSYVTQATFANAVMPGPSNCCPAVAGFQWCGMINSTGQSYGPVTYPPLTTPVTCPNGANAICQGSQWQLSPNWTTSFCGIPSQVMWQLPPCDTRPGEIVKFTDPNLEQCILSQLPGNPRFITVATAQQQLQVLCAGQGISDLGGLEKFTSLQVLDLTGNQITQFGINFARLQQLKLGANRLTQLDLSGTSAVVWLDVSDNQLSSLTGLANVYFQVLDVSNNKLTSLDISTQTSLLSADLSNNQITTVTDQFNTTLGNLKSLTYLDLSNNQITTIGAINGIAYSAKNNRSGRLTTLFLTCNPAFTCSSLNWPVTNGYLDGSYPAYQTTQCADFNTQSNHWIPNTYPNCPAGN